MNLMVTIGLATYNGSSTLAKSIESLLNQSYIKFKLIISDDASTDNSFEIAEKYALIDSRIVCMKQPCNLGPLGNFSQTLRLADSEFFMWASQDDLWSPNYLEVSITALKMNPNASYTIPHWICESRRNPLLRRIRLLNMQFLESTDPIERLLKYTQLPFVSFKDNITYGVYRKNELLQHTTALDGKIKYFSIGCVHNEFNILKMQAIYTPKAILRKRYKNFPPGYKLNIIIDLFVLVTSFFRLAKHKNIVNQSYSNSDYLNDLKTVLSIYGLPQDIYKQVISINQLKIEKGQL